MATRALRARPFATALLAATLIVAVAGCGGDDGDLPPPASPPAETPDSGLQLTPEEEQAVEGAQAIFDTFMAAYIEDATTGEPIETEMGPVIGELPLEYLAGAIVQTIQLELAENWNENRVREGQLTWEVVDVVNVDLDRVVQDASAPAVVIHYCMDGTDWVLVDKETREPVAEPAGRWLASVEAARTGDEDDARWFVIAWDELEGEPC